MERVDLRRRYPGVRSRWRDGGPWDRRARHIVVGVLPDGRWYVAWAYLTDRDAAAACAYAGPHAEHYARTTAKRWRRTFGGEWVEA
jgi:hypothetical protein